MRLNKLVQLDCDDTIVKLVNRYENLDLIQNMMAKIQTLKIKDIKFLIGSIIINKN